MSTRNNKKFLIGMAVAVLLPLSFYLIVKVKAEGKVKMPLHYKIETVADNNGKKDTIYHSAKELTLTNQVGETVSLNKDLAGKIVVVNFIFTTCNTTCPMLTKSMGVLQKGFRKDPKKENTLENAVQFVSITVLPEIDSVPVIRKYADEHGANPDHWWFLTGDKKAIYSYAKDELDLLLGPGDGGAEDMLHTNKLVLLDKNRQIRGYYDGTKPLEVKKCADDIVLLTMEKDRKNKKH